MKSRLLWLAGLLVVAFTNPAFSLFIYAFIVVWAALELLALIAVFAVKLLDRHRAKNLK